MANVARTVKKEDKAVGGLKQVLVFGEPFVPHRLRVPSPRRRVERSVRRKRDFTGTSLTQITVV